MINSVFVLLSWKVRCYIYYSDISSHFPGRSVTISHYLNWPFESVLILSAILFLLVSFSVKHFLTLL